MPAIQPLDHTINHLFRHQAGKMVAILTRIFGVHNLELAEDVVQDTLLAALEQWKIKGVPDNPESWLFVVAKNKALNLLKKKRLQVSFGDESNQLLLQSGFTLETTFKQLADDQWIKDDQLRMMFACCHPGISEENQITLILKTLCGFSTAEIARAFLCGEDTISKRLYRTKAFFRQHKIKLELPAASEIHSRTEAVLSTIYLLFNEGYNSTHGEALIRRDVLEEAMMLARLLAENPDTCQPNVHALLALMSFHSARSGSRMSNTGEIILLPEQDRSHWDSRLIAQGSMYLNLSAQGNNLSTYHLEAAIAYEHCSAESFEATNWFNILKYYTWLCRLSASPIAQLNKAIVVLQVNGPQAALLDLESIRHKKKLETYYLYHRLLNEIYNREGQKNLAEIHGKLALKLTSSEAERRMLQKHLESSK